MLVKNQYNKQSEIYNIHNQKLHIISKWTASIQHNILFVTDYKQKSSLKTAVNVIPCIPEKAVVGHRLRLTHKRWVV